MSGVRPRAQRRYRRRTVRVAVDYHSYMGSTRATATTLGAGGMFIATSEALPRGTRIDVCFSLPDSPDHVYEIPAAVVWSNTLDEGEELALGMGIAFEDPSACATLAAALAQDEPPPPAAAGETPNDATRE